MSQKYASTQPAGSSNYIRNIAIVGAAGQVGTYIVEALLRTGKHNITAVTRADSTSKPPSEVKAVVVDYNDHSSLVNALKGQDMLIITMAVTAPQDTSAKLIKAAADAEVPWVMPNEWGVDHLNETLAKESMIGMPIIANRRLVKELGISSCISFINGFWYEYSLSFAPQTYGFDFKNRKVTFYDDGKTLINTTTFAQVGRGVASLLSFKILPEDENDKSACLDQYRDSQAYVSSFHISQKDMFESVLRVTDTKEENWSISYEPSKQRYQDGVKEMQSGDRMGFGKLLYARVFYPDGSGEFEKSHGLDNQKLGLPQEDLDEATKIAVRWVEEKGQMGV